MLLQSTETADPAGETPGTLSGIVSEAIDAFVGDLADALPKLIAGVVFLLLAAVVVRLITVAFRYALDRVADHESPVTRRFATTVVRFLLWFGVALSFLSVVGFRDIAAALGTSSGFVALGVAYALSDMIKDAVAGIYLLRDPDFNPGDTITAGDMTGVVESIELRKTRIEVDGDTVVRANAEIEKRWTKRVEGPDAEGSGDAVGGAD